eukprot:4521744-Amphidinium_carterae.1
MMLKGVSSYAAVLAVQKQRDVDAHSLHPETVPKWEFGKLYNYWLTTTQHFGTRTLAVVFGE